MKRLLQIALTLSLLSLGCADAPKDAKVTELDALQLEKAQLTSINQNYEFNTLKARLEELQRDNAKTTAEIKSIYTEIFKKAHVDMKKYGLNLKERRFQELPPENAAATPPAKPYPPKQPVPVTQSK